jgi:hypothetical protein
MKKLAIILTLFLGACASQPHAPVVPRETLPSPPPSGEPGDMIGVAGPRLQALFGQPTFTRRENGSELWRYDGSQCHAFFFLYSDGNQMLVRHVETAPHPASAAVDPNCLSALRARAPNS